MSEDGFGPRLRALRNRAGLAQEELAERSGLSVRTIRDLERGRVARPRRETVRLLATALDLREDDRGELLRLARQPVPPARPHPVGTDVLLALPAMREPTARHTSRPVAAVQVVSNDIPTGAPSTTGAGRQVLHPVARGDALIVTVALTGAGTGPVTVTDTAANRYRAAGDARHRLLLFALLNAEPLDTLDEIDIRWPRATAEHVSVDAFHGITAAGPWGGGASDADENSDSPHPHAMTRQSPAARG